MLSSGVSELVCWAWARESSSRGGEQELTGAEGLCSSCPGVSCADRAEVAGFLQAAGHSHCHAPLDPPKGPRPTYRPMTAEMSVHRKVTQHASGRAAAAPESPAGASLAGIPSSTCRCWDPSLELTGPVQGGQREGHEPGACDLGQVLASALISCVPQIALRR